MRQPIFILLLFLMFVNTTTTWSLSVSESRHTPRISHPLGDLVEKFEEQKEGFEENLEALHHSSNVLVQQTRRVENALEAGDKGIRQFPCPLDSDIFPCECSFDESDLVYMNCTNVESELQLATVFQAEFPFKTLHSFYMGPNEGIQFFGNIFNGVTFEKVEVERVTNLELVSQYWLYESRSTLRSLTITHSKLHSETFPFVSMDAYEKLETLYISYANLTMVPPLHSETLTAVAFEASDIATVNKELFQNTPSLTYINLGDNIITTIPADTFRLVDAPSTIYLYQNYIENIEAGAFVLPSNASKFSLKLHVGVNKLMTLDEAVFGELLPYVTTFEVYGNPLECGCDLAWLITDEDHMAKVDDWAQCADGTYLHDIDPLPFEDLC